jgi:hypothetical protein
MQEWATEHKHKTFGLGVSSFRPIPSAIYWKRKIESGKEHHRAKFMLEPAETFAYQQQKHQLNGAFFSLYVLHLYIKNLSVM